MKPKELYDRVADRLPQDGFHCSPEEVVDAVLAELAERLTPDEAAELASELPDELHDRLAEASGDGHLERAEFIEALALRLELDDDEAEAGATATLVTLREFLEPVMPIEQMLERLPPDLAHMMHDH